jgi:hypothetical protein
MYRSTFSWPRHKLGVIRFTSRSLYPGKRAPCTNCVGGLVDPRAGLDDVKKWNLLTVPGLELDLTVVQPVASRYTDYAIPAPQLFLLTTSKYPVNPITNPNPRLNHCDTWRYKTFIYSLLQLRVSGNKSKHYGKVNTINCLHAYLIGRNIFFHFIMLQWISFLLNIVQDHSPVFRFFITR